jgi:hypothetical protein
MNSPKRLARIAGVLYLLVLIFGGFAEGFVEPKMYVAGNAAATVNNLLANVNLVRIGIAADLLNQVFFLSLAMTLYLLLKSVNKNIASTMVILVAISNGISCLNLVFEFEGLQVATEAVNLTALGAKGSDAMVLLLLDTQHYGLLISQIFFGLWLVPLGYLAYNSAGWFPRWLGILLVVGGACYLVGTLMLFLVPNFGQAIFTFVVIPPTIAEILMIIYLLVIGVKIAKPEKHVLAVE